MSTNKKLLWTVVCIVLTYLMAVYTVQIVQKVLAQYRELGLIK